MGKKQHYIPQFYLKNFSSNSHKNIGVFRFEKQLYIPNAAIKSVAYRDNLYDDDNVIENELARMERDWKELLDILLGRNVTNDTLKYLDQCGEEVVIQLFKFIAVTEVRTTQVGDSANFYFRSLERNIGKEMLPEVYEKYFGDIDNFEKHPNIIPLQVALKSISHFGGLDLIMIVNETKQSFLTSDVPVFNLNPYYVKRKFKRNFGLGSLGLQKLLPISEHLCICLYDRNVYTKTIKDSMYIIKSKRLVDRINRIIVQNAYEQIFFNPTEKERYVRGLCRKRNGSDSKSSVIFYGKDKPELIRFHHENIWNDLLLPCFAFKRDVLSLELPSHMGGLYRPEVEELIKET